MDEGALWCTREKQHTVQRRWFGLVLSNQPENLYFGMVSPFAPAIVVGNISAITFSVAGNRQQAHAVRFNIMWPFAMSIVTIVYSQGVGFGVFLRRTWDPLEALIFQRVLVFFGGYRTQPRHPGPEAQDYFGEPFTTFKVFFTFTMFIKFVIS